MTGLRAPFERSDGSCRVFAGEPATLYLRLLDADGNEQDYSGRLFRFSVVDAQGRVQADVENGSPMTVSGDEDFTVVDLSITAAQTEAILPGRRETIQFFGLLAEIIDDVPYYFFRAPFVVERAAEGDLVSAGSGGDPGYGTVFNLTQPGAVFTISFMGARGPRGIGADDAVLGPMVAVDDHVAVFNGTSGNLIKDGGKALPAGAIVGTTDAQVLTNKTLTDPEITSPTGLVKADVGLGNVDNTTDAAKPVSVAAQAALDLKAPLASPALTGVPTAPTAAPGTSTTQLATTEFAAAAVVGIGNGVFQPLDADLTQIAANITAAGHALIDDVSAPAQRTTLGLGSVDNTSDANKPVSTAGQAALDLKANLASPTLTGVPAAPTAAPGTDSTQLATTAFVQDAVDTFGGTAQPLDADLTAIAALASAADKLPYSTGPQAWALADFTAAGRALVDDATAAAQRATLGSTTVGDAVFIAATAQAAKNAITLGNVNNTSDANKPVSTATQAALDLKANLASPALTGVPIAPSAVFGTDTTQLATTAFVQDAVDAIVEQPLDATLTALAGVTVAADQVIYATGADAFAVTGLTAFGRSLIDDADATAGRVTLGVVIGTNVQAQDAELSAIAGLASAADKVPYFTGSGAAALADLTAFARTVLDDANAGAVLTTIGAQPLDGTLTAIAGVTVAADKLVYATGADAFATTDLTAAARSVLDDTTVAAMLVTLGAEPTANKSNDNTLAADSSTLFPTQHAVKGYVDGSLTDALAEAVFGPIVSINGHIATFDGTSGKLSQDSGTSIGDVALLYGATFIGDIAVSKSNPDIILNTPDDDQTAGIVFSRDNSVRWQFQKSNAAEADPDLGTNEGSNFNFRAIDDDGATVIGVALSLTRSSLLATFGGSVAIAGTLELGNAADTTLARISAGNISVEGNELYRANGTKVPIADGGTGQGTAANARTALGLGLADTVRFENIELGNASDTTLSRTGIGEIAVEGNRIFRVGGADVPLADGGTGASLVDPDADRIMFWDDSAGAVAWLAPGNSLVITTTTFDTAQDIRTTATPTFAQVLLGNGLESAPSMALNTNYGFFYDSGNNAIGITCAGAKIGYFDAGVNALTFSRLSGSSGALAVNLTGEGATGYNASVYRANSNVATNTFIKGRGTIDAPAIPSNGDDLGILRYRGWTSTGVTTISAETRITAKEATYSASAAGAHYTVNLCPLGSATLQEVLRVDANSGITQTMTDAATNAVTVTNSDIHATSGTAAAGFGSGRTTSLESAAGNVRIAARQDILWSDATNGSEDADWVLNLMAAGAAVAEKLRVTSLGVTIHTAPIRFKGYTVATLPAGTVGDRAYVTDALAPAFITALVGGGAVTCPAFYNGAAWVAG